MTGDLVAWLREHVQARLALARAATPGPWEFEGDDPTDDELYAAAGEQTVAWTRGRQVPNGRLMEANDPQDTIARCEAELAILAEYEARDKDADLMLGPDSLRQREWPGLRLAVRLLGSGYQHRPGYQEEWKP